MIIKKDPDLLRAYLEDHSNIKNGFCNSAVFPESEEEICDLMRSASSEKTPVTISGAGTGVTGARIPFGGLVLSTEKINKVLQIKRLESGEGEATVEPGVILKDFLERVRHEGFFYPPDPTEKSSFLGGNVATSASGARSFRFGTTRDYVRGLRVVLSNGEILEVERGRIICNRGGTVEIPLTSGGVVKFDIPKYTMPSVKNAAGYYVKDGMDVTDIFIGQEGTLGAVTRIRLKLLKSPGDILGCYAFFKKQVDALEFVYRARERSLANRTQRFHTINAISLEFFDKNSLGLLKSKHKNIPDDAEAAIYFEQQITKESEATVLDAWAELIKEVGGSLEDTWFAYNEMQRQQFEDIRHDLPDMVNEFIKQKRQTKIGTDIAVPYNHLDKMINHYNNLLNEAGLRYVIFGHIGDGHLHVNILPENDLQYNRAKEIYMLFVKKAVQLGGTVSAEHGIGKLKHDYLKIQYGKEAIREMAYLKKSLDPACILGLDNIFPKELLS